MARHRAAVRTTFAYARLHDAATKAAVIDGIKEWCKAALQPHPPSLPDELVKQLMLTVVGRRFSERIVIHLDRALWLVDPTYCRIASGERFGFDRPYSRSSFRLMVWGQSRSLRNGENRIEQIQASTRLAVEILGQQKR